MDRFRGQAGHARAGEYSIDSKRTYRRVRGELSLVRASIDPINDLKSVRI
jgi:hypothetical protein